MESEPVFKTFPQFSLKRKKEPGPINILYPITQFQLEFFKVNGPFFFRIMDKVLNPQGQIKGLPQIHAEKAPVDSDEERQFLIFEQKCRHFLEVGIYEVGKNQAQNHPKKAVQRANQSFDITPAFWVIPQLDFKVFDKNQPGDKFQNSQRNKENGSLYIKGPAGKTKQIEDDATEAVQGKPGAVEKPRIDPTLHFTEKPTPEQFYEPARYGSDKKKQEIFQE